MKCGWSKDNKGDISSISYDSCPTCPTWTRFADPIDKLPKEFMPRIGGVLYRTPMDYVSLACKPGRLVVRIVYKILKPSSTSGLKSRRLMKPAEAFSGTLATNVSPARRCELDVPDYTARPVTGPKPRSEIDAALRAKEVNCRQAVDFYAFGDFKEGGWYSDTYTMDWSGCEGLLKPTTSKYNPARVWVNHDEEHPGFLVATFEVREA